MRLLSMGAIFMLFKGIIASDNEAKDYKKYGLAYLKFLLLLELSQFMLFQQVGMEYLVTMT